MLPTWVLPAPESPVTMTKSTMPLRVQRPRPRHSTPAGLRPVGSSGTTVWVSPRPVSTQEFFPGNPEAVPARSSTRVADQPGPRSSDSGRGGGGQADGKRPSPPPRRCRIHRGRAPPANRVRADRSSDRRSIRCRGSEGVDGSTGTETDQPGRSIRATSSSAASTSGMCSKTRHTRRPYRLTRLQSANQLPSLECNEDFPHV